MSDIRLIDANALKKAIDHFQYTDDFCIKHQIDNSISLYMLKKIIDNAPTVPLPDFKDGYKQAIIDGIENKIKEIMDIKSPSKCFLCNHLGDRDYCSNCHSDHSLFEEINMEIIKKAVEKSEHEN